jgi:hypothetical protein
VTLLTESFNKRIQKGENVSLLEFVEKCVLSDCERNRVPEAVNHTGSRG